MTIETIKQAELMASEREVLLADRARWTHMGAGGHLDEWLAYGSEHKATAIAKGILAAFKKRQAPAGRALHP